MKRIESFNTLDDLFDMVRQQSARADEGVQEWQEALQPGDFFAYAARGLPIIGEVLPYAGVTDAELAAMDPEDAEAYREEAEVYKEPHMRHYRFTRCYSRVCPYGEMGDLHVSRVALKLSKEEFEKLLPLVVGGAK